MLLRVDDLTGTHAVAAAIAGVARPGDVIVLAGEMGAGKTAFAQGFGRALGVTEPITSPTFTLVHSYPLSHRLTLHHADIYRLERTRDIDDLALPELAAFNGIVLVEWGDVAGSALGDHLEVRISHVDDLDKDLADEPDQKSDRESDQESDQESDDDPDHDLAAPDHGGDAVAASQDEFADPRSREIELRAVGAAWAGRWDRIARGVERFRC
jgi:tRNA threonylcarbamoyladenosine biosynthesis protein TsaE